MTWLLSAIVVPPLLAALAVVAFRPGGERAMRWSIVGTALAALAAVAALVAVAADGPVDSNVLAADRAAAVLAVMTLSVAVVVQVYAARALRGDPAGVRFAVGAAALAASVAAVALAATPVGLLVAWVVSGLALVGLLGHHRGWAPADRAVRLARTTILVGDAALAAAVVAMLVADVDLGSGGGRAPAAVAVLLVVAGATRSALIPFHRWLPATLAAPTPVSAMLHAGVVNAMGVLLVTASPVFAASAPAAALAFVLGAVTAVWATAAMLVRTDVKGGLVWSTAGQMGFMTVQLAVGAFAAALFHIVGHAMYKAAAFLGAGGAVAAHAQHRHAPTDTGRPVPAPARFALATAVPALAIVAAFAVIDPHLTRSGMILVAVFGFCSAANGLDGWLRRGALAPARAIGVGVAASLAAVFGYVGGLSVFESFVAPAVPFESPATVGPNWLLATIAVVAVATLLVGRLPGLRRRLYTALLFTAAADARPVPTSAGHAAMPSPTPPVESTLPRGAAQLDPTPIHR